MKHIKLFEDFSKDYEFEKGKVKKEKNIDAAMKKGGHIRVDKKGKTFTKLYTDDSGGSEIYTDRREPVDTYRLARRAKKDAEEHN